MYEFSRFLSHPYWLLFICALFCSTCKVQTDKKTTPSSYFKDTEKRNSSYYLEDFGAIGDGKTDDTQAFLKAIQQSQKRTMVNDFKRGGWGAITATEIRLQGNKTYRITRPIIIPPNKNISFRSDAMGGAMILYDGPGNTAIRFKAKGINAAVLIDGINFKYGGIELIGSLRGKTLIQNNQFLHTRGPGINIIDREDAPSEKNDTGFGVVHWVLWNNEFHYCDQGIYVDSKSILLGTIKINKFRFTTNEPIYIDGTGIIIENNEFLGIKNRKNPFIRLSPKNNYVAEIKIEKNRFGSEAFTFEGIEYAPPESYVLIDDHANYISNIDIRENMFFTNKKHIQVEKSANQAITIRKRVVNLSIENNDFKGFKKFIINNEAHIKNGKFLDNNINSQVKIFKKENAGFTKQ